MREKKFLFSIWMILLFDIHYFPTLFPSKISDFNFKKDAWNVFIDAN